jgi:hypothetical protein
MKHSLAGFLVERAARWSCHPWMGGAMRSELHAASEDGHAMRFALGCAWATLQTLPTQRRGFAIGIRLVVALALALPFAILEINGARLGIQFIATGHDAYYATLLHGDASQQALASVYRQATPLITLLLATLGLCQVALIILMCRVREEAARPLVRCIVVAGLVMAAIILALRIEFAALAYYIGIPLAQWCLIRWMDTSPA